MGASRQRAFPNCYTMLPWERGTSLTSGRPCADELPDAPCLIHGDDRRSWREVDRRADGVAQHLLDAGLERQQAVAQYLYNGPEYMESIFAAFKARLRPGEHQLPLHRGRAALPVGQRRRRSPWCSTAPSPTPSSAIRDAAARRSRRGCGSTTARRLPRLGHALRGRGRAPAPTGSSPEWGRTGDDLYMLYTGGTTGMPKGVMWRQDDLAVKLTATLGNPLTDDGVESPTSKGTFAAARRRVPAGLPADARHRQLPVPVHAVRRRLRRHPRRAHFDPSSCSTPSSARA